MTDLDCLRHLIDSDILDGPDAERSGQWHEDEPGEPTAAEIYAELGRAFAEMV